jgi:hypothetical protein
MTDKTYAAQISATACFVSKRVPFLLSLRPILVFGMILTFVAVASEGRAHSQSFDSPLIFAGGTASQRGTNSAFGSGLLLGGSFTGSAGRATRKVSPFSTYGFDLHVGINGGGFDVATPLAQVFNLRIGGDFLSYSDTFEEQGANVTAGLHLASGHGALDWFPFAGSFRVSPLVVFANNNRVRASVIVPPGTSVTLSGSDYNSSATDPLRGSGSIDFRKTAPGLSLGFGNLIPRSRKHFSFPTELGFFYVGQPKLKVNFTGSACDPTEPASIGCQSVDTDSDFQASLVAFRARNNNNLKYASFYPIFSAGVGYSF